MGWSDPHTLIIPLSLSKVLPNGVPTFSPAPHMPTQSCTAYHTLSVCTDSPRMGIPVPPAYGETVV